MTVMPGAALFRINGLGTVWVNAEVPESLAAYVRPGNGVAAKTAAMPDVVFKGKVSAILPEVSTATRTLKARVELANPGGRLVPGMFATVDFAPRSAEATLLVPSEAVIRTGKRTLVIVARGGGTFAPLEVEAGGESNGETGIRKGLTEGQEVVTSAQFLIDSEASLRASANRLAGGTSPAAPAASAPQAPTHKGTGRIEAIDGGEMTLSHGPIASLQWPAMTMGFALADPALARGLGVGRTVEFEFHKSAAGEYRIVALRATADGGNAAGAAAPAHDHGTAQDAITGGKR
jgi:Cu(I)/Ag(I) efflux system membrane fusion protein